ncbi:hypothetical protein [Pararhizobium sp. PWRC1-1]|uniref:hypothetical protein n=1 Tax=Pararhizobium sp. PWRC1-1 TaxID=2804566 RepID=UPI003CEB8C3F
MSSGTRLKELGANAWKTPETEELTGLVSRVTRLWVEISEADLAFEIGVSVEL